MKKPACASKQDALELANLRYFYRKNIFRFVHCVYIEREVLSRAKVFFRLHALFECGVVVVGHSISDKLQNWPLTNSRRGQSTPFGSLSTYQFEVESNLPLRTVHSGQIYFGYVPNIIVY